LKAFTLQGWMSCQLKMTNVQGDQAPANWQKMLKIIAEQSMGLQTLFESVTEFSEDNRKFEDVPHCSFIMTMCLSKSCWKIQPHGYHSPDLASCDSALFPKWKWKWRDDYLKQSLTSKGINCKWYSTSWRKMTSKALLKCGKNFGIALYIPKKNHFKGEGSQNWVSYASILFDVVR
jgi:hypothetical protein